MKVEDKMEEDEIQELQEEEIKENQVTQQVQKLNEVQSHEVQKTFDYKLEKLIKKTSHYQNKYQPKQNAQEKQDNTNQLIEDIEKSKLPVKMLLTGIPKVIEDQIVIDSIIEKAQINNEQAQLKFERLKELGKATNKGILQVSTKEAAMDIVSVRQEDFCFFKSYKVEMNLHEKIEVIYNESKKEEMLNKFLNEIDSLAKDSIKIYLRDIPKEATRIEICEFCMQQSIEDKNQVIQDIQIIIVKGQPSGEAYIQVNSKQAAKDILMQWKNEWIYEKFCRVDVEKILP